MKATRPAKRSGDRRVGEGRGKDGGAGGEGSGKQRTPRPRSYQLEYYNVVFFANINS